MYIVCLRHLRRTSFNVRGAYGSLCYLVHLATYNLKQYHVTFGNKNLHLASGYWISIAFSVKNMHLIMKSTLDQTVYADNTGQNMLKFS